MSDTGSILEKKSVQYPDEESEKSGVKQIDEHYKEVIDKIMNEYFEDEESGAKSNVDDCLDTNNNNNDAQDTDDNNNNNNHQVLKRAESRDIYTQTEDALTTSSVKIENKKKVEETKKSEEEDKSGGKTKQQLAYEKNEEFRYANVHFAKYNDTTKENFHNLHRYNITHTLPSISRNRILIDVRALGVDRLNIGLFGSPGSGKSALLNTMYAVVTSQYYEHSPERKLGKRYRECVTNKRLELRLTESISILDNRGINFSKASLSEIRKQCEGLREAEEDIPQEWKSTIAQKSRDVMKLCNKRSLLRDRVHCPVIVSSITQDLDKNAMKRLVHMIKQACFCDPIVIILTNIHDTESTKTFMTKSRRAYFESIGCKSVYDVNIYTSSNHRNNIETDEKIISFLNECCLIGDKAISATLYHFKKTACC